MPHEYRRFEFSDTTGKHRSAGARGGGATLNRPDLSEAMSDCRSRLSTPSGNRPTNAPPRTGDRRPAAPIRQSICQSIRRSSLRAASKLNSSYWGPSLPEAGEPGWIAKIRISDESGLADLLDAEAYAKQCAEEE
jgi:hypothetical protein